MGTLCRNGVAGLVHPPIELWTRHDYTLQARERDRSARHMVFFLHVV